jgi:hypothetical protein
MYQLQDSFQAEKVQCRRRLMNAKIHSNFSSSIKSISTKTRCSLASSL